MTKKHPVKLGHRFVSFLKLFCHLVCHCNIVFLKEDLSNTVGFFEARYSLSCDPNVC